MTCTCPALHSTKSISIFALYSPSKLHNPLPLPHIALSSSSCPPSAHITKADQIKYLLSHRIRLPSRLTLCENFHLPLSFGSNSASSSALVGSADEDAASAAAAAALAAATALEAPLLVAVLVSDFFMVSLTLWPRKTAWIFVAALAAINKGERRT